VKTPSITALGNEITKFKAQTTQKASNVTITHHRITLYKKLRFTEDAFAPT
jgi:hypothetical protein